MLNQTWNAVANIGPALVSCSNVTHSSTSFCCDHDAGCCNSGSGRFDLLPADPEPWATWDNTKSRYVVVKALPTPTTNTSGAFTTASTTISISTNPSLSTSSSTGATGIITTPAPTSSAQTQGLSGLSTAVQAGIGVGVSVGAILLGLVAYLLWRRNQRRVPTADPPPASGHLTPLGHAAQSVQVDTVKELSAEPPPRELGGRPKARDPTELPG